MNRIGKRKRLSGDTERQTAMRASAAHLRDLERAHGRPPPDVVLGSVPIPLRIGPEPAASYCTSSSQLCAELIR
jgi:hypothetical protein